MNPFSSAILRAVVLGITALATGCAGGVVSGPGGEGDGESHEAVASAAQVDPPAPDACDQGARQECELEYAGWDGTTVGYEACVDWYGPTVWTECLDPLDPCAMTPPGETCNTPLVLVWDQDPVVFSSEQLASFDLTGQGISHTSDWPTAATPWLALDRDGDGVIGSGEELFGSATVLSSGARAANGFDALRELDENGDGQITEQDRRFAELLIWTDGDGSRTTSANELTQAASRLVSIELENRMETRCDARGNCEGQRARFTYVDASGAQRTGAVVDVYLRGR